MLKYKGKYIDLRVALSLYIDIVEKEGAITTALICNRHIKVSEYFWTKALDRLVELGVVTKYKCYYSLKDSAVPNKLRGFHEGFNGDKERLFNISNIGCAYDWPALNKP